MEAFFSQIVSYALQGTAVFLEERGKNILPLSSLK